MSANDAQKAAWRRYHERHREERNARARARYIVNRRRETARSRAWRQANQEWLRQYERQYRKDHLEEERAKENRRYAEGRKKRPDTAYLAKWEKENRPRRRARHHERKVSDPQYILRRALRARLKMAIKRNFKTGSAVELLGCSIAYLKAHLEALWLPGMSWQNFGRLHAANGPVHWQIDHKRPLSSFDLTDPEQLATACHHTNLQPLWALDNRKKGNKTESIKEMQNVL